MKYISKYLGIMFIILLMNVCISARNPLSGLVITEIFLDNNSPRNNWIEVYNPTDEPLLLEMFRLSHIRTINVLQRNDRDIGIKPNEIIILCSDKKMFNKHYHKLKTTIIEVSALSQITDGGFISLRTKDNPETGGDIVRYGIPTKSSIVQNIAGDFVVQFSKNKSYARKIIVTTDGEYLSEFNQLDPTPGQINN